MRLPLLANWNPSNNEIPPLVSLEPGTWKFGSTVVDTDFTITVGQTPVTPRSTVELKTTTKARVNIINKGKEETINVWAEKI